MSRSPLFHQFSRTVRIAWFAERNRISTSEALERVAEVQGKAERQNRAARGKRPKISSECATVLKDAVERALRSLQP